MKKYLLGFIHASILSWAYFIFPFSKAGVEPGREYVVAIILTIFTVIGWTIYLVITQEKE